MTRFAPQYRRPRGRDVTRPIIIGAMAAGAMLYAVTWLNVNEARSAARVAQKARDVRKLEQEILVLQTEVDRREQAVIADSARVGDLGLEWPRPGRLVLLGAAQAETKTTGMRTMR